MSLRLLQNVPAFEKRRAGVLGKGKVVKGNTEQ